MSQPPKTYKYSPIRFDECARRGRDGHLPYVNARDQYMPAAGAGGTFGLTLNSIAAAI